LNLLDQLPENVDRHELRALLGLRVGEPGQYDGESTTRLYLPLAREACRIVLVYDGKLLKGIEPGPAFNDTEWASIVEEVRFSIMDGLYKVGRDYSFVSYRVMGTWRGERSGVQILAADERAPRAPVEMALHPFILEFPLQITGEWSITNARRIRTHRRLTMLLNVLLAGRTSFLGSQPEFFWATVPSDRRPWFNFPQIRQFLRMAPPKPPPPNIRWVQEFYFAPLESVVNDELSRPTSGTVEVVDSAAYYESVGHDGRGLRVPSDLDASLVAYQRLTPECLSRFNRAMSWMNLASRFGYRHMSASYVALVSAIESLAEQGATHRVLCPDCGGMSQHRAPGPTEAFRRFFDNYAPGASQRRRRTEMYDLRSKIVHGNALMELDEERGGGRDPPWHNERSLHDELFSLSRLALRNWLNAPEHSTPIVTGRD
jgi:Apea-like HEPN